MSRMNRPGGKAPPLAGHATAPRGGRLLRMNEQRDPRPTPPEGQNPTKVRQGVITGRVLVVLVISIVLAVLAFVLSSLLA